MSFETAHECGEAHTMTGWSTATPGVVVILDGPPNTPCGFHQPYEEWCIWLLPGFPAPSGEIYGAGCVVAGRFADPESAMHAAELLGEFRAGRLTIADLPYVGPAPENSEWPTVSSIEEVRLAPSDQLSDDLDYGGW